MLVRVTVGHTELTHQFVDLDRIGHVHSVGQGPRGGHGGRHLRQGVGVSVGEHDRRALGREAHCGGSADP